MDTREQRALAFPCATRRQKLPYGDYGCLVDEEEMVPVVFERKSVPDLFGSMSKGYERFRRMLRRANGDGVKVVIIVEGSLRRVLRGYARSQRSGQSVVKQLFTLRAVYDVEVVFSQDRDEASGHVHLCFDAYRRLRGNRV